MSSQKWHHAAISPDIRLVSRYPILQSRSLDGNGAFLIDLGYGKLVYIVAHLPCCENETQRQQEVGITSCLCERGIRFGISPFQVPQSTPVIISGDMNFVGLRRQQTFVTGDIGDNGRYGRIFNLIGTKLTCRMLSPSQPIPSSHTFYMVQLERGTFSAGRLDYFCFTNSVMDPEK